MKRAPREKAWRRKAAEDRERLFTINPRCHWCGVVTVPGKGGGERLTTLDHIKGFHECGRNIAEWDAKENKVIACYACNNRRSAHQHPAPTTD